MSDNSNNMKEDGTKNQKTEHQELEEFEDQIDQVKSFFIEFTRKALSVNTINGQSGENHYNLSQIKTLAAFHEDRSYSMGELSKSIGVATPRMTILVDELENEGLAVREPDTNDRRVIKVRLTSKGKDLLQEFNRQRRRETGILLRRISESDRVELLDSLGRAAQVLKKLDSL